MYKVHRKDGLPICVIKELLNGETMAIPFNKFNKDFNEFLEWNAKQEVPLDYQTPIAPEKHPDEIKQEQAKAEVKALKDKLIQGQKLTDKERAEVIDSLIQLLG